MNFPDQAIHDYMTQLTPPRHAVFQEMEVYAAEHKFPIIGPLVARFLQQAALLAGAKRIFEMGSGYGYSALHMAQVIPADGRIHCTEGDEENIAMGQRFASRLGVAEKIAWHHGDALEQIKQVDGPFDLILCDVDKHQYPDALRIAWPKLRRGGVMVTDNVLWSGRIVTQNPPDDQTRGILDFSRAAYQLPDALSTIIPLRDGLMFSYKL